MKFFSAFVLGVGLLVAVALFGCRQVAHHLDVASCRGFGAQSGYETRFVEYAWLSWDCLAKTNNGKWVSTNNLARVNP